jgi:predicted porin
MTMKKSLVALGVLSAFAGAAHAQSSVTLYGLIDEGFDFNSNVHIAGAPASRGGRVYELQDGLLQGSRWGLKGQEDLGGGLQAVFQLENGFNLNTGRLGQGGLEFGRQAYVGLASTTAGTVTLGRQYDSVVDYLAPTTANGNWGGELFSHPYDNDNTDNSFRLDNAIKYTSINYSGLQFGGAYAFSNTAGNFSANRAYSLGASYTNGPILVGAAYMNVNKPGLGTAGAITATDASFIAGHMRTYGVGANYTYAAITGGLAWTHSTYDNPTSNNYTGATFPGASNLKFDNYEANVKYQLTPAVFLGGMYVFTQAKLSGAVNTKPDYHTFGLMADYSLSKRTDVYVQGAYMKAVGGAGTGLATAFVVNNVQGASTDNKQLIARVGIRHQF